MLSDKEENVWKRSTKENAKYWARRISWVANQLFWSQLVPIISGAVTKAGVEAVSSKLPNTSSSFVIGHVFRPAGIDGVLLSKLVPKEAWAKYAVPKGLPNEGERTLAIENEPHFVDDFDGEIPAGYGKGVKTLLLSDKVIVKVDGNTSIQKVNYHVHEADRAGRHFDIVVTGIKPGTKQWELNIPRGQYKGRYAFITTDRGMLVTKMKDQGILLPKPDYTLRKEDQLDKVDPLTSSIERKYDGSLGNAHIKDFRVAFRSHRTGPNAGTYYDKLPALEFIQNKSPLFLSRKLYPGPNFSGTVFQGELVHPEGSTRVSGILNSLAPNARIIQQQRGPVSYYVWDILKYRGRDVSDLPYSQRRSLYEEAVQEIRHVNKNWYVVERMEIGETPKEFYNRVIKDPLPYGEGLVIKPLDSSVQKWDKIKVTGFDYYTLYDILPGEGKYAGSVGRMVVENRSNGARGEVGSLSVPDDLRGWIWQNREFLLGQTVKVRSQEVTARGVPRAGVFVGFHDSEVELLMAAEANAAGTDKSPKEIMYAMKSAKGWRKK